MSQHSKALAALTLGVAVVLTGLLTARHVLAVSERADRERLNRVILEYIAEKNPQAPIKAFQRYPDVVLGEAARTRRKVLSYSISSMSNATCGADAADAVAARKDFRASSQSRATCFPSAGRTSQRAPSRTSTPRSETVRSVSCTRRTSIVFDSSVNGNEVTRAKPTASVRSRQVPSRGARSWK